ncbi:hypothetical protein JFQ72_004405 [Vibrio parahaemolyticus]|nr:hypothetical protein [Vibrio parahaemolyticus]
MIDKQVVIDEVMRKHGIVLSKDDPILAFLAVHDVLIDSYTNRINNSIITVNENLEAVTMKHTNLSKELSERMVGVATNELQKETKLLQSNLKNLMNDEQNRLISAISELVEKSESNKRLTMYGVMACAILTAATAFTAYMII